MAETYIAECRATLDAGMLVLENSRARWVFEWNGGHLIGRQIVDRAARRTWVLDGVGPDVALPGVDALPGEGDLALAAREETAFQPAHLQVDVTAHLGALEVRRRFRLYPGCPALACDLYLRGAWAPGAGEARLGRLGLAHPHLDLEAVRFYDGTDRHNTLVEQQRWMPFRHEVRRAGSLLLIGDRWGGGGLWLLKEAPCGEAQLAWPGADFLSRGGEIAAIGVGIEPHALQADAWTRGYGLVVGLSAGDAYSALTALRAYQEQVRRRAPGRDEMIMLNTWGDRGQDTRLGEPFALAELEGGARLGVTHFQLDDGWQSGRSSNSAFAGGSLEGIWERADYWTPHPERFPNGLGPVADRARALGIELCLWFNPSKDGGYAHWQDDAETLIGLYRQHGIRTFKIDGVYLPDQAADHNLRAMFDRVMVATGGEAMFNLDVTAGRRWGYHYGGEYGNLFLENRYTDWGNYYPHWTLRNLWMLARYLPAQKLQIEFLNLWRNETQYPDGDPLAPARVPFAYCFATTMAAQPLAWFEASGLPEQAFTVAPLIHTYRAHQGALHAGCILPVGEEPAGRSWTGFQSISSESALSNEESALSSEESALSKAGAVPTRKGYLLVYREWTERERGALRVWGLDGARLRCRAVAGQGTDFETVVDGAGWIEVALPRPFSFALYRYQGE